MAHSYIPVDRDQLFLLPPDVRDWLPEDHLAWFVIEVVDTVDTSLLHARHRNEGVGRRAFDPDMMLALLVYSYCVGQRSSRQIERLCSVDTAYRVLSANEAPDHSTIARFRQDNQEAMRSLFVDVLTICEAAGLAQVGMVALDGTKMGCPAALASNRRRKRLGKMIDEMLADADAVDIAESQGSDDGPLPPGMRRRGNERKAKLARLREGLDRINTQPPTDKDHGASTYEARADRAAANGVKLRGRKPRTDPVADAERDVIRARVRAKKQTEQRARIVAAAAAKGVRPRGRPARDFEAPVRDAERRLTDVRSATADNEESPTRTEIEAEWRDRLQANIVDPDSRMMKTSGGWVQGYNAQAVVNTNQIVVGADVTQDHNDLAQYVPLIDTTIETLTEAGITADIGIVLADAGYCTDTNLTAPGPDRLIATTRRHKQDKLVRDLGETSGPPPADASPIDAMKHRLRTPDGRAAYKRRSVIVEPVFGQIKSNLLGYDRFPRRGLTAAKAEWFMTTACHNLRKVFDSGYRLT